MRPTVLLVHDDIAVIASIRRLLARESMEVVLATSVSDAVVAYGLHTPTVMVLASSLEEGRGYMVLEELSFQGTPADLTKVIVLGEPMPDLLATTLSLPLDGGLFLNAVHDALAEDESESAAAPVEARTRHAAVPELSQSEWASEVSASAPSLPPREKPSADTVPTQVVLSLTAREEEAEGSKPSTPAWAAATDPGEDGNASVLAPTAEGVEFDAFKDAPDERELRGEDAWAVHEPASVENELPPLTAPLGSPFEGAQEELELLRQQTAMELERLRTAAEPSFHGAHSTLEEASGESAAEPYGLGDGDPSTTELGMFEETGFVQQHSAESEIPEGAQLAEAGEADTSYVIPGQLVGDVPEWSGAAAEGFESEGPGTSGGFDTSEYARSLGTAPDSQSASGEDTSPGAFDAYGTESESGADASFVSSGEFDAAHSTAPGTFDADAQAAGDAARSASRGFDADASSAYDAEHAARGEFDASTSSAYDAESALRAEFDASASSGYDAEQAARGDFDASASSAYDAEQAARGQFDASASTGYDAGQAARGEFDARASSGYDAGQGARGQFDASDSSGFDAEQSARGQLDASDSSGFDAEQSARGQLRASASSGHDAEQSARGPFDASDSSGFDEERSARGQLDARASSEYDAEQGARGQFDAGTSSGYDAEQSARARFDADAASRHFDVNSASARGIDSTEPGASQGDFQPGSASNYGTESTDPGQFEPSRAFVHAPSHPNPFNPDSFSADPSPGTPRTPPFGSRNEDPEDDAARASAPPLDSGNSDPSAVALNDFSDAAATGFESSDDLDDDTASYAPALADDVPDPSGGYDAGSAFPTRSELHDEEYGADAYNAAFAPPEAAPIPDAFSTVGLPESFDTGQAPEEAWGSETAPLGSPYFSEPAPDLTQTAAVSDNPPHLTNAFADPDAPELASDVDAPTRSLNPNQTAAILATAFEAPPLPSAEDVFAQATAHADESPQVEDADFDMFTPPDLSPAGKSIGSAPRAAKPESSARTSSGEFPVIEETAPVDTVEQAIRLVPDATYRVGNAFSPEVAKQPRRPTPEETVRGKVHTFPIPSASIDPSTGKPRTQAAAAAAPAAELPASGARTQVELARLFLLLEARKLSARIDLESEDAQRTLWISGGRLVAGESNLTHESILDRARKDGLIDGRQERELRLIRASTVPEFLTALRKRGYLREAEVLPLARRHAELVAIEALGEDRSDVQLHSSEESEAQLPIAGLRPLSQLALEALRRTNDGGDVLESLGGLDANVAVNRVGFGELFGLIERERTFLAVLEMGGRVEDVLREASMAQEAALRLMGALEDLGLLVVEQPASAQPGDRSVPIEVDVTRLETKFGELEEADYFSMLGVSRGAGNEEVERAFDFLRNQFDPLKYVAHPDPSLQRKARAVQDALGEAAEALRDDRLRRAYARHLVE